LTNTGIEFDIYHSKAKPSIVRVYGNSVHILVGNYYEISNGPIDLEWIRKYNEKYNDLYEDKMLKRYDSPFKVLQFRKRA